MAIQGEWIRYGSQVGYFARPDRAKTPLPSVVVIQEIMGVNDQIEDITRRIAAAGYAALAPDLYVKDGERPAALLRDRVDEAMAFMQTLPPAARFDTTVRDAAMAGMPEERRTRILESFGAIFSQSKLLPSFVQPLREAVSYLRYERQETKGRKVGCVGFCMGGGLSALLACEEDELSAAAMYYGKDPEPEKIAAIGCPVLAFYGSLDERVTSTLPAFALAMKAAGKSFESHVYDGANHSFFNDSGPGYNVDAARDSFARLLGFFAANLTG
jgi:carboxymethylenebutenolidase